MEFTYGIVGIEGVTVTTSPIEEDMITAQQVAAQGGKDYNKVIRSVTFNRRRKTWAQDGAEDVKYFPTS